MSALLPYDDQVYRDSWTSGQVSESYLWAERLAPLLHYLPSDQARLVRRVREALSLAYDAHDLQRRRSGEPYITHPVEVTRILAELGMDYESIVAGLLHDTVEDCGDVVGLEEIGFAFGEGVRRIVEGETKFSKLPSQDSDALLGPVPGMPSAAPLSSRDAKAQDMHFMFLAMSEEIRIIVVKLADRLHNMRTLGSLPEAKQERIAKETLQVFAPLARLLGLYLLKEELEGLAFRYAHPAEHAATLAAVESAWAVQAGVLEETRAALQERLSRDPLLRGACAGVAVTAQRRSLHSVWRRVKEEHRSVHGVRDVCQLVVVLTPRPADLAPPSPDGDGQGRLLCYHALGLVHSMWTHIPGSFRDYIAQPKMNNYQALHTKVMPLPGPGLGNPVPAALDPPLFPIGVQLRTASMHRLAEYGIAVECWGAAPGAVLPAPGSGRPTPPRTPTTSSLWPPFGWRRRGEAKERAGRRGREEGVARAQGRGGAWAVDGSGSPTVPGAPVPPLPPPFSSGGGDDRSRPPGHDTQDMGSMSQRINWLNCIRQWQEEFVGTLSAWEFVQCVTDDLLGQGLFVFTPSGQVKRMPKPSYAMHQGSTVVDFAYHMHTGVGNAMVAARVNGRLVPDDHRLVSAEVVEIVTRDGPMDEHLFRRQQDRLHVARTKTARHKIARFLKQHAAPAAPAARDTPPRAERQEGPESPPADGGLQSTWLTVQGQDRAGLLADVAAVIGKHGYNIQAYNGSARSSLDHCMMVYKVEGHPDLLSQLCQELSTVQGVEDWAVGRSTPRASPGTATAW